jgi:hypothetical protein
MRLAMEELRRDNRNEPALGRGAVDPARSVRGVGAATRSPGPGDTLEFGLETMERGDDGEILKIDRSRRE